MGKLDSEEPRTSQLRRAAVSVILRDKPSPSILLIKRAERDGDPWSGQVAFPGGKSQEGDATLRDTAVREAQEEVGIDLVMNSDFLGYFTPFRTHTGTMDVVPTVFLLREDVEVRFNEEVSSYQWVRLDDLTSLAAKSVSEIDLGGQVKETPAFVVGGYVVWGLTHRIISALLE